MIDAPYDEWIPYVDYEKAECDVKLKDGSIVYHCWPNAGKFNPLCSDRDEVPEEDVEYIMYRKYYRDGLCESNCNGDNPDIGIEFVSEPTGSYIDWETVTSDTLWSSLPMKSSPPLFVRTELKIQRNDPCSCGSGKKFKKCCINK